MHTVTREWIFANTTDRGAWTREQLKAIGVDWPPRAGWIDRCEGLCITDDAKRSFEYKITAQQMRIANRLATTQSLWIT